MEYAYHATHHENRRRLALKALDPSDVIATVESRLSAEADPAQHPLYGLVCWLLDRQLTPLDGGLFWDTWKQRACQAIDTRIDEALARGED